VSTGPVTGLTLDTGALIAIERGNEQVRALLRRALAHDLGLAVPAGVVGQAWRGGAGAQVPLARLLADPKVHTVALDGAAARAAGVLCGTAGHPDVIDASVVICARERGHSIVTSDPDDMAKLDHAAHLIKV
jgi:hypothetical protein